MIVRSLLLGLLIAGVTPIGLADAIVSSNQPKKSIPSTRSKNTSINSAGSCMAFEPSASCVSPTVHNKPEINSDLWLQEIANVLLPGKTFPGCWQQSPFTTKPTAQKCIFSRKNLPPLKPGNIQSVASIPLVSNYNHRPNSPPPKFPKLSRSSLIVSVPQENSFFIPDNTKLVNPAPETTRIASPFGWRIRPYSHQLQFHQGIDYGAPFGSPVVAVGNGIVTKVVSGCLDFGNLACGGQLGNWIEIDHGNGAIATYGHLKHGSIAVREGMKVLKNQAIAQVGSSGWSTGAHLDFRLKINGKHEDPTRYIATSSVL